ncbi:unnamed protein product [Prunus brigantina]
MVLASEGMSEGQDALLQKEDDAERLENSKFNIELVIHQTGHMYSSDKFLTELFCAKSFTYNIYGGKLRRFVHHHFGQQCGFLISPPQDISGSSRTPDIGSNYLLRFESVSVSLSRQLLHMSI